MNVTSWDYAESGLRKTKKLAEARDVVVKTELTDLNEASWKKISGTRLYVFLDISQKNYAKNTSGN